jgi:hypothetical protein
VGRDGVIEVREGAYDGRYHFVDGLTGLPVRSPLVTRDLAKGSATSDPDGFPLYYAGSRDGRFRVVALDRAEPVVLWSIQGVTSVERPLRNDDWDGAALVVDDVLFVGGENGWLYVVRLHRDRDDAGQVTVAPEVVAIVPGFDEALLRALAPGCDPVEIRAQLDTLVAVAEGRAEGGHLAAMPQSERFHWLTAPSSTVVQPSAVHTGLTSNPAAELDKLFAALVTRGCPPPPG